MSRPALHMCTRLTSWTAGSSSSSAKASRSIHTTRPCRAAPSAKSTPLRGTPKGDVTRPSVAAPTSRQPARGATPRGQSPTSQIEGFNWRPMKSRRKGYEAEERLVFQRPFEAGPNQGSAVFPLIALGAGTYGMMLGTWRIMRDDIPPDAKTITGWLDDAATKLSDWLAPPFLAAVLVMSVRLGRAHMRTLTRISHVRVTPVSAEGVKGKPEEFARIVHGGHYLNMGVLPRYKDVPLESVKLYRRSESIVMMDIDKGGFNTKNLLILLAETPKLEKSKDEVVVSLSRLEQAFGPLRIKTRQQLYDENKTRKFFDKLLGYDPEARWRKQEAKDRA